MPASAERRRGPEPAVRPRYGRMSAAGGAVLVTLVTTLGGLGVLPSGSASAQQRSAPQATASARPSTSAPPSSAPTSTAPSSSAPLSTAPTTSASPAPTVTPTPAAAGLRLESSDQHGSAPGDTSSSGVPPASGSGRRIVFDMSEQRVWLVDEVGSEDEVARTYPVSGSVTDNLHPGTYAVYSKSLHAVGIDDSGTMEYMVRFAHGPNAAIGFHDVPVSHGRLVQTREQLGTARSHGCIRQWRPDARALWRFAPVGTKVVVLT